MIHESPSYKELKAHLRDMFQMEQPDLDFGIYRIMNQKRAEIEKFLDKDLLPQVRTILKNNQPNDKDAISQEITKLENNLRDAGIDPETSPKVQQLRQKMTKTFDIQKLESELYSDLYNFFKRYYSEGDFMSLRRYKEGVYALPYEGEEVKLHWANHDQYYIKTSENLKNYSFKTSDNQRVRFEITQAGTELNNNKADKDKERRFILHSEAPIQENGNELIIRFEFRVLKDDEMDVDAKGKKKGKPQDKINLEAFHALKDLTEIARFGLLEKSPTDKNPNRTKLEKHLTDFTAKNSFDYFIHKDLGKFLRQELDFYIKNEIMHLDDIDNQTADYIEGYLSKIRAMRAVAGKIITFLASLEDFQKKLWLKKKFVLDTNYCITLDHIIKAPNADELLGVIASNQAQIDEWVKLFAIDEVKGDLGKIGFDSLGHCESVCNTAKQSSTNGEAVKKVHQSHSTALRLDCHGANAPRNDEALQNGEAVIPLTAGIQSNGRESVIASEAKQSSTNGEAVKKVHQSHSTALRLDCHGANAPRNDEALQNAIAFLRQNDKLLIDTKFFSVAFKYRLLSLFDNLDAQTDGILINSENFQALNLLQERYREKIKCIYIDPPYNTGSGDFIYKDAYQHSSWLSMMQDRFLAVSNLLSQNANIFAQIDYNEANNLLMLMKNTFGDENYVNEIIWRRKQATSYSRKQLGITNDTIYWFSKTQEYTFNPIYSKDDPHTKEYIEERFVYTEKETGRKFMKSPLVNSLYRPNLKYVFYGINPPDNGWLYAEKRMEEMYKNNELVMPTDPNARIYRKIYEDTYQGQLIQNLWTDISIVNPMAKERVEGFTTQKPSKLIERIITLGTEEDSIILDYFAGSGTTAYAIMKLNSERGNKKLKFILIEMGEHFTEILLPRVKKTSHEKKSSGIIKYMTLEQYEDTLDNLGDHDTGRFGRTQAQQNAFDNANKSENGKRFYEGYMLSYMLDIESRGSHSLLNIDKIDNPFDYRLKITRHDETHIVKVDLIETFNYLLGLVVQHIDYDKSGIIVIKGVNALGEKTMIIWRNVTEINNQDLDKWFSRRYSAKDFEFDAIYVNGDNNIENMKLQGDMWKVRLIEAEFKRLMFSVTDV